MKTEQDYSFSLLSKSSQSCLSISSIIPTPSTFYPVVYRPKFFPRSQYSIASLRMRLFLDFCSSISIGLEKLFVRLLNLVNSPTRLFKNLILFGTETLLLEEVFESVIFHFSFALALIFKSFPAPTNNLGLSNDPLFLHLPFLGFFCSFLSSRSTLSSFE